MTEKTTPPMLLGFALVMLLPVFIAVFDVLYGNATPYITRLTIWNLPWVFVGAVAIFLSWADARRAGGPFIALGPLDLGVVGLLAVWSVVLSRTVAENPSTADLHLLRLGLAFLLGVSAYYGMKNYQHRFSNTVYRALLVAAIGIIPMVLVFIYAQEESRSMGDSIAWYLPGIGAVRLFGIIYEVAIAVCIGLLVTAKSKRRQALLLGVVFLLWVTLFWSGSRGAFLSLLLSTALVSVFYRAQAAKIWLVFVVSGVAGALASLLLWVPEGPSFGLMNMLNSVAREDANAISAGRLERWLDVIILIQQQPLVGYGLNQFSNMWDYYVGSDIREGVSGPLPLYFLSYRHVHNIVLEALFSWGLIGGAGALILLLKAWLTAAKRIWVALPAHKLPAFYALNALLFHSNLTGIYIFAHSLFYMAIFFGICLAPNPAQNRNTNG